ncbi:MAG: hypothetical protein C0505_18940 [Leptothrix sp. (in: Bacteria)]|nr:hypothetical protein [Leptothrix sp. (in: b-proteobacteria)]
MPKRADGTVELGRVGRRVVEAAFEGGDVVSNGGVPWLWRVAARLGLTRAAALTLGDERRGAGVPSCSTSTVALSGTPVRMRDSRCSCVRRSSTRGVMPCRCSSSESRGPAGPVPTIGTGVFTAAPRLQSR